MSQPIRLWSFCRECAQQLLPLVFPEFMAEVVELITTQEVFLLDLFQGIMELPELRDQCGFAFHTGCLGE